jgi:anti-anti-sigma factor
MVLGAVVVEVHGKLIGSYENCEAFHHKFKSLLNSGHNKIVVELSHTPWANSQGIGMLIGAHTSVTNAGGKLVLASVNDRINGVLAVTKLNLVFRTFDGEDGAVKYLNREDPRHADDRPDDRPPAGA